MNGNLRMKNYPHSQLKMPFLRQGNPQKELSYTILNKHKKCYTITVGTVDPLRKGEMPMVTYENLIQIGLFLVALIGLVYKIISDKKDKK